MFPMGLLTFALALATYKAAMLTSIMMVDWRSFLFLLGLDALYLSILLLLGICHALIRSQFISRLSWLFLLFLTVTYLVDSFVLLALNEHAPLFDIGRYALEPRVVFSFFDARAYVAIVLLLVSMLVNVKYQRHRRIFGYAILMGTLLAGAFSAIYAPLPLARYAMLSPAGLLEKLKPAKPESVYSAEQVQFYSTQVKTRPSIPESKPNIVLLIVESLSSINSKKVSGVDGFLDGFDALADKGLLFRNFFANHQASEGGLIALLGGYPPIHFPTASPYMFDEFAIQPSILGEYMDEGYSTEFLTNARLSFIGLNRFLEGLGVDRSRGRDEVAAMAAAQVIVQDAPSDAFLYDEALKTIEQLSRQEQPFLLTLATTSTHLPYKHPENGDDTPKAVWQWSLDQLTGFYQQLEDSGYFEKGVLLITGDHRQMRALTATETARYHDSARARVPLLLIGNNYPAGAVDDRFFQQADLLRMLASVEQKGATLSPQPIWVERYNRKYGHIELIDSLSVFDEADSGVNEYQLQVPGNQLIWLGNKPSFSHRVELLIHAQRSQHQQKRLGMQ